MTQARVLTPQQVKRVQQTYNHEPGRKLGAAQTDEREGVNNWRWRVGVAISRLPGLGGGRNHWDCRL